VGVNHFEFAYLLFTLPLIPSRQGRGNGILTDSLFIDQNHNYRDSAIRMAGHDMPPFHTNACIPRSSLATMSFWICVVPSGIVITRAPRKRRSTGYSGERP